MSFNRAIGHRSSAILRIEKEHPFGTSNVEDVSRQRSCQAVKVTRKVYREQRDDTSNYRLTDSKVPRDCFLAQRRQFTDIRTRGSEIYTRFPLVDPAGLWLSFFPNYATRDSVDESAFLRSWMPVATFRRS